MKKLLRLLVVLVSGYIAVCLILSALVSIGVARWAIIEHRRPFVLIDVACATVQGTHDDGRIYGYDQHSDYISFGADVNAYAVGTKTITAFVFSPLNNYTDGIAARLDVLSYK